MNRKVSSIILCVAGLASVLAAPASAQVRDIDYDWMLVTIDVLLSEQIPGFSYPLSGRDRDGNGIREEDTLGMLSTILRGGSRVAAIPDVATIQADFAYNRQASDDEMVATGFLCTALGLAGYDCRLTNLLRDLVDDGDVLSGLLLDFFAGLTTTADTPQTFNFINSYIDYLVDSMGALIPPEYLGLYNNYKNDLKNDLHFNAGSFRRWGSNGSRPNRFGAVGDVDTNGSTNISVYGSNREAWLSACSMVPPIHVISHPTGGTYFTGEEFTLNVSIAGGTAPFSYQWEIADFPNVTTITDGNGVSGASTSGSSTTGGLNFYYPLEGHNGWRIWARISDQVTAYNGPAPGPSPYSIEPDRFGGRTSKFTQINVQYRPFAVRTQPTAGYKNPGQSWDTQFVVWGGRSVPTYQWYKVSVGALSGQTNRSISLSNLQYSDEGQYYCRATGDEGTLQSNTVFLGVRDPMSATTQPTGGNFKVGDAKTFSFGVSGGNPPLTFEWYRANIGSPAGTGGSLVFTGQTTLDPPTMPINYAIGSLTAGQQGQYYCSIRDMAGQVVTSDTVPVRVLAIFQQPLPQDVKPNFPATFEVTALAGSGVPFDPPPAYHYQWYFDNDGTDAIPPVAIGGATNSVYTIPVTTAGVDNGLYSCVITDNAPVSLSSASALLTITADPIIFLTQPQGGRKYTGEEHIFSVTVTGGSSGDPSRFKYYWMKNTNGTWADLPGKTSSSFVISSLTTADQGMYVCEVGESGIRDRYLALKPTNSQAVFLEVAPPLTVTGSPEDASLYVGESFSANLGFSGGLGTQRFQWFKDGTALAGATDETLVVPSVTLASAGKYRCDIEDDRAIPLSTNFAWLSVFPSLAVSTPPAAATVDYGDSHVFTLEATGGIGDLHYQWKFNDEPVGDDEPLLVVSNATDVEEGAYSCDVTDSRPSTVESSDANLTVNVPFAITAQPASYATYVGGNYTMFVTVIGAKGSVGYQWWFDPTGTGTGAVIPGANSESLAIVNATTADRGRYRVVITDSLVPGTPLTSEWAVVDVVNHLNFTQQPVPQSDVPVNGSAMFAVQVDGGIGTLTYQWYKNNVSLALDPSIAYATNQPTLTIPVVTANEEGAYKCVVNDQSDTITSEVATLTLVVGTPVAGPVALGLLSMVLAAAGAWVSRKRK